MEGGNNKSRQREGHRAGGIKKLSSLLSLTWNNSNNENHYDINNNFILNEFLQCTFYAIYMPYLFNF